MAATPELQTSRAPLPGAQRAAQFWRWWRGELSRMLPERFAALGGPGAAPVLLVEDEVAVAMGSHGAPESEKRASLAGLDEPRRRATVRTLLEGVGETRGRARAGLRHDEALVRRVTLPAATEENLAQVLAFEMDRLSPFQADEVYFDQRVVSRDAANGQIVVELAMARRGVVDARVRELRSLGVSVQGVVLRDDARRGADTLDLLPSDQRGEREMPRERAIRNALIAAVVLLLLATLVFPVWRKRDAVVDLIPVVERARVEAQATDAVVRDLERQAGDYNYLLARKHGSYPVVAVVEEISRLLPDNTWLQQLDVRTSGKVKEVVLTGETASSSKLIELLEQSKMLQNAAPRGPTTRGSQPGSERFMIGAEVRSRTPPEAQPLGTVARPAPPPPLVAPTQPAQATPTGVAAPPPQPTPAGAVAQPPQPATLQPVPAPVPISKDSGFGPRPKQ